MALAGHGQVDAAIAEYQRSLEINPHNATVHRNLGLALASAGRPDEAAAEYRKALKIDPNEAVAHGALGMALAGLGRLDEAVAEYRKALKINPNDAIAYNKLAWIRATHPDPRFRDGAEAVTLARWLLSRFSPGDPTALGTLAAAYAEAGRFSEAAATARDALELARRQDNPVLAATLQRQLVLLSGRQAVS